MVAPSAIHYELGPFAKKAIGKKKSTGNAESTMAFRWSFPEGAKTTRISWSLAKIFLAQGTTNAISVRAAGS